jgi:hypothetical protein
MLSIASRRSGLTYLKTGNRAVQIPITKVRYTESQARQLLDYYLYANSYGSLRTPRGIAPDQVSKFLLSALKPDSPAFSCERALEAMRFYELPDLSSHLQSLLNGRERSDEEIRRSAFLLQALSDLGTPIDGAWAASYFDRILLPKNGFASLADLLLDTLLVLAPYGSPDALVERLHAELAVVRGSPAHGDLWEMKNNRLPGLTYLVTGKKRLLTTSSDLRANELISIYLVDSDLSHPYLVNWAARVIRRDAMQSDTSRLYADFGKAIDSCAAASDRDSEVEFTIVRAAQAILYLKGTLTPARLELYSSSHPENVQNFLWDDAQ